MLRTVSTIYIESQALELFAKARRDVFMLFRTSAYTTASTNNQTVQTPGGGRAQPAPRPEQRAAPPPSPPPAAPPRRAWTAAAALALTASLGGVYFYRKILDTDSEAPSTTKGDEEVIDRTAKEPPVPAVGSSLPQSVQYLLVGGGTASFAALRAIRSARPDAQVLVVSAEGALPYMRPPLSKELWREPDLAQRAHNPDTLTFRQWNGKRRSVVYEPNAFYTPVEELTARGTGAAVARGWRVTRLDVARHEAELVANGQPPVVIRYDKCLVATGARPVRLEALRHARAAGRVVTLRGLRDAARLAALLDEPHVRRVALVGGGFLASELSAALADRLRESGATVTQLFRERAPMADVLPEYLAAEAARRLTEAGVALLPEVEVVEAEVVAGAVRVQLSSGATLETDLVIECVGSEPETAAAETAGLELDATHGGVLVNAELQARSDVFAAGDVASFHDPAFGRRRVEHHDHAVVSGRLAGENMAAVAPPKHYKHQSMFWSDLGPQLGYEAIGIIDSRLPTVGVFSADAVSEAQAGAGAPAVAGASAGAGAPLGAAARRYERGVVFYLREKRVVGVLLWNLFNRMHVARQVLAAGGELGDLFEVGKLFAPQDDD